MFWQNLRVCEAAWRCWGSCPWHFARRGTERVARMRQQRRAALSPRHDRPMSNSVDAIATAVADTAHSQALPRVGAAASLFVACASGLRATVGFSRLVFRKNCKKSGLRRCCEKRPNFLVSKRQPSPLLRVKIARVNILVSICSGNPRFPSILSFQLTRGVRSVGRVIGRQQGRHADKRRGVDGSASCMKSHRNL